MAEAPQPTLLFATNEPADRENARRLAGLPGEALSYQANDWPGDGRGAKAMEACIAPRLLSLKLGAHVMLLKNIDPANRLVNGSRGVVTGFGAAPAPVDESEAKPVVALAPSDGGGGLLFPRVSFETSPGQRVERLLMPEECRPPDVDRSQGLHIHKRRTRACSLPASRS